MKNFDQSFVDKESCNCNKEAGPDKKLSFIKKFQTLEKESKEAEFKYRLKVQEYNDYIQKYQRELVSDDFKETLSKTTITNDSGEFFLGSKSRKLNEVP